MNKIIINKENNVLNDNKYKIEYENTKTNLNIIGDVIIYDFNNYDDLELNIELLENSSLEYYMFSDNNFKNKNITITNNSNSKCKFNYSFYNSDECNLVLNNNIIGDNIYSNLSVRAVANNKAIINIDSNGYVSKDTKNNEFLEDVRGLNLDDGFVKINPNMFIDSNDVIANHNTTIGNINKDYLFYLKSKGILEKDAKDLIIKGFINSILCNEMLDK